ncbi:MAG: hypothetical protein QM673_06930, partial [Gordonia sp. (in: high G+C Gram-positive bacteria)]
MARLRRPRDWGHIPRTRVRTSTAVVGVLFIVAVVLYGYTSQRYGVVSPVSAPVGHDRSTSTPVAPSSLPAASSVSVTSTPTHTDESGQTTESAQIPTSGLNVPSGTSHSTTPSTVQTVPGQILPGVPGAT